MMDLSQFSWLAGPLGLALGWMANRKLTAATAAKTAMEAQTTLSDSALKFLDSLKERIDKLEAYIEVLRKENVGLHAEIASLKTELRLRTPITPLPS
jgi:cell division protein FtsB